jgi:DNA helicase II / ATP-dependent DNA helicase PcrA
MLNLESELKLESEDWKIITEEEQNLSSLIGQSTDVNFIENREDLLKQIFELREQLGDANEDDIPQLTEQISRITLLINQGDRSDIDGVNKKDPYFAHMRLSEGDMKRDIYIGIQVFRSQDSKVQIVDWKSSPIAIIYFRYDQDEDYEEEIDGRIFTGTIELKRILKVNNGKLSRIQQGDTLYIKDEDFKWHKLNHEKKLLKGGTGTASRPDNTKNIKLKLGIGSQGNLENQKLLSEITGLIDPEQFEIITRPETGIVAIQGAAGSGKTTVALHRVAWLHFQDQKRFHPEKMLVMVFNRALANYISKVLPSLGVEGVQIDFFENWISRLRFKIFGSLLSYKYTEHTPVNVIKFKKNPILITIINSYIKEKSQKFNDELKHILKSKPDHNFPLAQICGLPFVERLHTIINWVWGKSFYLNKPFIFGADIASRIQQLVSEFVEPDYSKRRMVIQLWEDLFSDFLYLKRSVQLHQPDFKEQEFYEVESWLKRQYILRQARQDAKKNKHSDMAQEDALMDYEDDPIVLLFYQLLVGRVISRTERIPEYNHLMIDEAQDLCPLELKVLLNACRKPQSLTLAGDINQKLIQHNSFDNWDNVFEYLGVPGQQMSALRVSYRSTNEIMSFSLELLGELATASEVLSTRNGPPVELFQYSNPGEMIHTLSTQLKELVFNEPMASVAVICFSPEAAKEYYQLLDRVEIFGLRLIDDQNFPFIAGIDVVDIKQVKGLEFDYVILLDVDTVNYPVNNYSRYLLHIGATRAAHQLWIMNYRVASELLPQSLTD